MLHNKSNIYWLNEFSKIFSISMTALGCKDWKWFKRLKIQANKQKTPTKNFTFHKRSPETARHNNAIDSCSSYLFAPVPQYWPSSLGRWQGGSSSSRDHMQEREEFPEEERFFPSHMCLSFRKEKTFCIALSLLTLIFIPESGLTSIPELIPGQTDRPCLWPIRSTYWAGGGIKFPEALAWQVKAW